MKQYLPFILCFQMGPPLFAVDDARTAAEEISKFQSAAGQQPGATRNLDHQEILNWIQEASEVLNGQRQSAILTLETLKRLDESGSQLLSRAGKQAEFESRLVRRLHEIEQTYMKNAQVLTLRLDEIFQALSVLHERFALLQGEEDLVTYLYVLSELMQKETEIAEMAIDLKREILLIGEEARSAFLSVESELAENDEL